MSTIFSELAPLAQGSTAWLLTYGIHSTVLLALAALVSKYLPLPSREALWKTALLGGLFTATLQLALAWQPMAGAWSIDKVTHSMAGLEAASWSPQAAAIEALAVSPAAAPSLQGSDVYTLAPRNAVASEARQSAVLWPMIAFFFWAALALAGISALAFSYRRLMRCLADRQEITAGSAAEILDDLHRRQSLKSQVSLFRSEGIGIPIAHGPLRGKICIPGRALSLPVEEQESLLAHELAHVARRDPLWLLASRTLERVFFFQPLNRLARRRLQEIAEFRSDDWAAQATGRPLSLARCLTEVAGWNSPALKELPASAMAVEGSGLSRRVRRLLAAAPASEPSPWSRPTFGVLLLAVILIAPGFTGAGAASEDRSSPPPAPEAPEAPAAPEAEPSPDTFPAPAATPLPPRRPSASAPSPPAPPRPVRNRSHDIDVQGPEVRIPEIEIPEVRIPEIRIPEIHVPPIRVPPMNLAALDVETVEGRSVEVPEMQVPEIRIPEIRIPEIRIPEVNLPKIHIPEIPLEGLNLSELPPEAREEIRKQLALAQEEARRAQEEIERHLGPELRKLEGEMEGLQKQIQQEVRRTLEENRDAIEEAQRLAHEEARRNIEAHREEIERARAAAEKHRELSVEQRREIERARAEAKAHRRVSEEDRKKAEAAREKAQKELRERRDEQRQERDRARDKARRKAREDREEAQRVRDAHRRSVETRIAEREKVRDQRPDRGERDAARAERDRAQQRNNEALRLQRQKMMRDRTDDAQDREKLRQEKLRQSREEDSPEAEPTDGSTSES